jgi:arylsulfatase A-like enzyme
MRARPNLLILMADQLSASVLPAYGGKVAKTPHLDALADAGVVFESFYCKQPAMRALALLVACRAAAVEDRCL